MTTTELTKPEPVTLSLWEAPTGGWASDGNEDVQPHFPVISIVQPMSKEGKAGKFFHSDTEESTDELNIVALYRRETRALFPKGSEKPVCRSDDGRSPADSQPLWSMETVELEKEGTVMVGSPNRPFGSQPSLCTMCPFSRWGDNGEPPPCSNSYVLLVDRGENDLAQLRIKGTSIKPYRNFVAEKVTPKGKRIFWFRLNVKSVEKTGPARKWYEMVFSGTQLSNEEAQKYNAILTAQRARFEETVVAEGGEIESWEDEDQSAWMAELAESLDAVGLDMAAVGAFLPGVRVTEENIKGYMTRAKLADISEFVAAVEAKTI